MQQKKDGFLQNRYEKWEEDEWLPATASTPEKSSEDEAFKEDANTSSWGLQPFVEKWRKYLNDEDKSTSQPEYPENTPEIKER